MNYVIAIPLLPALAFVIMAPLSNKARNAAVPVSVGAILLALGLSVAAFLAVWPGGTEEAIYHSSVTFATIGSVKFAAGFLLDPISATMLMVITVVGAAVQIYSIGYMHRDGRIGWYYAVLSLFTGAMLALVLADNFLELYMAWEVMGLCSYLLIGFWHEQVAPRKASIKAFLTTRVGDVGFALALAVMYQAAGSFDFAVVLHDFAWAPGVATTIALLLLFGAMGKSAQVPLHVWLPDAMAGPTPASALIHAATMVAAGVFLVARALPIFEASGVALTATMLVGVTTALVGGLLASVQHDIKKVLAYSTISQLGYMFIALGAGGLVAGFYHLVTHAFFKSLLFLGAGVIIHAAHTQDMREMGGLAKKMPVTTITFTIGSLALAGIFPFSGFWSKDEILTVLWNGGHYVVFALALFAALVTAFYVSRLWFRVFSGPEQTAGLKEAHIEMLVPMGVLAAITAVIGFGSPHFAEFLGHEGEWPAAAIALTSTAVAGCGFAIGWWVYGRRTQVINTRPIKARLGFVYDALALKLYFDLTYDFFIVRGYSRLAETLWTFDRTVVDGVVNGAGAIWRAGTEVGESIDRVVIDGAVNGLATLVRGAGARVRRLQSGRVQAYQGLMLAVLVVFMLYLVVKGA